MIIDRFDGLQSMTDRNGNQLVVHSERRDVDVDRPRSLAFVRDGAGRITEIRGPSGQAHAVRLLGGGRPDVSSPPRTAASSTFTYDASHRLLSVDGPGGIEAAHAELRAGRAPHVVDRRHRQTRSALSSDVNARTKIMTSPSGRLDDADDLRRRREPRHAGRGLRRALARHELRVRRRGTGDPNDQVPLGRVETLTYDAAGNVTSRTTPKNETWMYAFNALNQPTTTDRARRHRRRVVHLRRVGNLTAAEPRRHGPRPTRTTAVAYR